MDQLTAPLTVKRYRVGIHGHPITTFVDGRGRACRSYAPGLKQKLEPSIVLEGLSEDDAKGRFMRMNGITQTTGTWIASETQDAVTPLTLAAPEEPKPEPAPKAEEPKPEPKVEKVEAPKPAKAGK